MSEDVKFHVKCCTVCNIFSALNKKPRAALQKYLVAPPMDRISIDVIGPLPRRTNSNIYILVIGNHFTRWVEAYPLPNQQDETIAVELVHAFIVRYGTPLDIHSDQGKNFEISLFSETCKLFEVSKTRTILYGPVLMES